ncbi:hypothetical protein GOP47_0017380 [Adiantum capillus-veneris]|uniref:Glycosyl transferase CAP10 domain-containing protein n=1 Tax=Adiantum capillus-veneris TaxID=13818 RepID=A0A9D4UFR1_ADICA|nr:hypothetical protein GOP47_0017380 [Adiantum capillus-veneris]
MDGKSAPGGGLLKKISSTNYLRSHCCLRPAAVLITCFAILLSFLLVTASCLYIASPDKLNLLLWHVRNLKVDDTHKVWPSSQFWQNLTMDRGRQMHNNCAYSGCPPASDPQNVAPSPFKQPFDRNRECPFYFHYIHEDLSPWTQAQTSNNQSVSVSKEMLNKASPLANFRVVIKKGRLYVDAFVPCFQTRAIFTIWGLLQLLRLYPGLVPDIDLLFGCGDTPRVFRRNYQNSPPPPVFRYCTTPTDFDIPFPDWSFWGWPEVNLKPWDGELFGILKGENELLWEERHPTAFWKGNTDTGSALRKGLQKCNGPQNGATIVHQDWYAEMNAHFRNSKLAEQCRHRYKIYAEGWGWSVSLKYIMACDSPAFIIDPVFHDFFSRGLMPMKHFWPVRSDKLCDSIKFGTEWGNNNTNAAEAIGRSGRQYVTRDVSMKHVYDYMLHVLLEYGKLLDFEPIPGNNMKEVCVDAFLCQAPEQERVLYKESMVHDASEEPPCFLSPRDEQLIQARNSQRLNIKRLVHEAEDSGDGGAHLLSDSNGVLIH